MARLLYALSGDGYGHAVRAHSVADGLIARGHELRFLTSGKGSSYLRQHYPGCVDDVFGLFTVYDEGVARPWPTLLQNARRAIRDLFPSNGAVKRLLREFRPDLVITDFEPFSAFWCRSLGVPFVSLDNQHLLTHCAVELPPGHRADFLTAYLTIRLYYGGARRYLITSFIPAPVRFQPATVVDPILRPQVYAQRPARGDFLLAYKGAGGENEDMRQAIESSTAMPIRAYGFGLAERRGHVEFKGIDADEFLRDLASCAGVISTAGHSLIGECLHLEKAMLLVPIAQQFEQLLNAWHVERMGLGMNVGRLSVAAMSQFVDRLAEFSAALAARPKASIEAVLTAIEGEIPSGRTSVDRVLH